MEITDKRQHAPRNSGRLRSAVVAIVALLGGTVALAPTPAQAATCAPSQASDSAEVAFCGHSYGAVKTQDGTIYRSAVDATGATVDLALDVWEPVGDPASQLRPVLLWMHGGYFAFGARTDDQQVFEDFASRGFVVVSIDYRLRPVPPGGGFAVPTPEAVQDALEDAVAAVGWIHGHAVPLRIDPGAVIASGYSAGAITALGLAHKHTDVSRPGSSTPIAAAVSFSGLDLFDPRPSRPDDPPVLMFNGDQDGIVPFGAAQFTCTATVRTGSECDLVEQTGQGHNPGSAQAYQLAVEWLSAHGVEQLDACERFDVPTIVLSSSTTSTTTTSPVVTTTSSTTTSSAGSTTSTPPGGSRPEAMLPPTEVGGASPALPVGASPAYTG